MRFFALILALLVSAPAIAGQYDTEIREIISRSPLKKAEVGIYAVKIPVNKELVGINKDEPLNPASCAKLVTTAAALKVLGPNYKFQTKFFTDTDLQQGIAQNLWVKGYGDPKFVIERLEETVDHIKKSGLRKIVGNIYYDDSFFEEKDFPGRQKKSTRSYNAPTSALSFNHGSVTVEVSPGSRIKDEATVKIDAPGMKIINMTKTGPARSKSTIRILRTTAKGEDTVKVSGNIAITAGTIKKFFSVSDPSKHFAESLKKMMEEKGITVTGLVKPMSVPQNAKLFYTAESPPLSEVLKDMNKLSNNFIAEMLLKSIGAKASGGGGSTSHGIEYINKYLASIGIKNFYLENGSGLSYENQISANDIVRVMLDIYSDRNLRDVFIDSLSTYGIDGTTKKRRNPTLFSKLKVKTGTLNNVSTLSGFMPSGNEMIAFSIIFNGHGTTSWNGHEVQDEILEAIANGYH